MTRRASREAVPAGGVSSVAPSRHARARQGAIQQVATRGIAVNGRFRAQRTTGVQRVAIEIERRLQQKREVIEVRRGSGALGHAWEQTVLPLRAGGRLLWSPCSNGPVSYPNQIVTIHDAALFEHPEWFSRGFVAVNRLLLPRLARRVRCVVTVSEYSRLRLARALGLAPEAIEVVPNAVDPGFAPASAESILAARARLGLEDRPYFVSLATQEPRKNLRLVLDAWRRARPHLPHDAVLLLVGGKGSAAVFGKGEQASSVQDEGVRHAGYLEDSMLPPLLSDSLGVLYPSIYEGFGLPILEAMACGAPVVTTPLTSLPEVGGTVAFYVDASEPSDLAAVIERLAGDEALRKERGRLGVERAARFSWDEAARRMDEIFGRYA